MTDVILADRDTHFAQACVRRFEEKGVRARHACNGSTCLRLVEEEHPGVVIISMALDGLAGFELVSRLREIPHVVRPFAIAIVALAPDPDDLRASRTYGCSGYFVRSYISIEAFIHRIHRMHLSLSRSSG